MERGIMSNSKCYKVAWLIVLAWMKDTAKTFFILLPCCWNKVNLKFSTTKHCQTIITHNTNRHCLYTIVGKPL